MQTQLSANNVVPSSSSVSNGHCLQNNSAHSSVTSPKPVNVKESQERDIDLKIVNGSVHRRQNSTMSSSAVSCLTEEGPRSRVKSDRSNKYSEDKVYAFQCLEGRLSRICRFIPFLPPNSYSNRFTVNPSV